MDDVTVDRRRLRDLVARHVRDERTVTSVPGLTLYRRWSPTLLQDSTFQPSLSLVVQGRKRTILGHSDPRYGNDRYLITPMEVPVVTQGGQSPYRDAQALRSAPVPGEYADR